MPTTTRWPAAQDGLKTLLAARAGLDGVPVDVGYPKGGPKREHLWITGEVEDWNQEWETTAVANAPVRERFTLILEVYVIKRGASFDDVRSRLLELVGEAEATVRADFTLNGAVAVATLAGGRIQEGVLEGQREMHAEVRIACDADLAG